MTLSNYTSYSFNMGAEWQEMLIEAVRRRPVLWDKSHIDFKDGRGVKRNNWVDVAAEVMLAVEGFTTTGSHYSTVNIKTCVTPFMHI